MNPTPRRRTALALAAAAVLGLLAGCSTAVAGTPEPMPGIPELLNQQTEPSDTDDEPTSDGTTVAPVAPPSAGSVVNEPWPPATIPEGQRKDPEVLDFGFTGYDVEYTGKVLSYAVTLRNPNESSWVASAVYLDITFKNDAGVVLLADQNAVAYTVVPGATAAIAGTAIRGAPMDGEFRDLTETPTKMEVAFKKASWFSTDDVAPGKVVMGPAAVTPGADPDNVSVFVTCDAASSYLSQLASGSVDVVFRDSAGKIIGGNSTNSNIDNDSIRIPGEAKTPIEMEFLFSLPNGVPAAECYPSFVGPI